MIEYKCPKCGCDKVVRIPSRTLAYPVYYRKAKASCLNCGYQSANIEKFRVKEKDD